MGFAKKSVEPDSFALILSITLFLLVRMIMGVSKPANAELPAIWRNELELSPKMNQRSLHDWIWKWVLGRKHNRCGSIAERHRIEFPQSARCWQPIGPRYFELFPLPIAPLKHHNLNTAANLWVVCGHQLLVWGNTNRAVDTSGDWDEVRQPPRINNPDGNVASTAESFPTVNPIGL